MSLSMPVNPKVCKSNQTAWATYKHAIAAIKANDPLQLRRVLPKLQCFNCDFNIWPEQKNLLHWSAQVGSASCTLYLLGIGADPRVRDKNNGANAMHIACYYGSADVVKLFVQRYGLPSLDVANRYGEKCEQSTKGGLRDKKMSPADFERVLAILRSTDNTNKTDADE